MPSLAPYFAAHTPKKLGFPPNKGYILDKLIDRSQLTLKYVDIFVFFH